MTHPIPRLDRSDGLGPFREWIKKYKHVSQVTANVRAREVKHVLSLYGCVPGSMPRIVQHNDVKNVKGWKLYATFVAHPRTPPPTLTGDVRLEDATDAAIATLLVPASGDLMGGPAIRPQDLMGLRSADVATRDGFVVIQPVQGRRKTPLQYVAASPTVDYTAAANFLHRRSLAKGPGSPFLPVRPGAVEPMCTEDILQRAGRGAVFTHEMGGELVPLLPECPSFMSWVLG